MKLIEPYTTTHDSIPAKTGENDGDRTSGDCISGQAAIDKFIDGLEEIFSDIREREVDDSVCGLCEYDGAYIGQSGDWCNECPGFDRDDCFKLSDKTRKKWTDEIIKALPSAQPEINCSEIPNNSDTISRQAVTKFLNDWLSCLFENCHKQSASDLKMIIKDFKNLPSAQPERKDAVEKAVAVEAISDELMSRFDISATYGYDFAEAVMNRIEAMAKELERGEQE